MNPADSYVYVLFKLDGTPCYVGKGTGRRCYKHFRRAENPRLRAEIKRAGGSLPIVKIREGLTDSIAAEIEVALIAAIGRGKNGPLFNLTNGGDGTAGRRWTDAQRTEKIAYWSSPEGIARKARQRELAKKQMSDPDQLEKLRARNTGNNYSVGRRHSETAKAAIAAATAARNASCETSETTRAKRSENMRAQWADPSRRAALLEGRA